MSNTFDKLSVLDSFIEEVNSYLPEIEANLERLAASGGSVPSPGDMSALEETYRRTHSIGGSAAMMDFPALAHVAHGMEDMLDDALEGLTVLDEPALGLLQRSLGRLYRLLAGIRTGIDEEVVLAEDDADHSNYRALLTHETPNNGDGTQLQETMISETVALSPVPQTAMWQPPMPSLEEVLATFKTSSVSSDETTVWSELPVPPMSFDDNPSQQAESGALETVPISDGASLENEQEDSPAHTSKELQMGKSLMQQDVLPKSYSDVQHNTQALAIQASSLKSLASRLHQTMSIVEAQHAEFRSFLDGSQDALDRMEDWAGRAMGLNLRNSPQEVRRYLPLSVMWVSDSRFKELLELLNQITGGVESSDEQLHITMQQLESSLVSYREAFQQVQEANYGMTQKLGWTPWEMRVAYDAEDVRQRVTFERRGDAAALRAELEVNLREEFRREKADLRAELERQIREELLQELQSTKRLYAVEVESNQDRQATEAQLRDEIEIQVRQEFLHQIAHRGEDAANISRSSVPAERTQSVPSQQAPPSTRISSATPFGGDFPEETVEIFRLEAEEHLQTISLHVEALEKEPTNLDHVQTVRRATHTLKGAAAMIGIHAIADLCHLFEDLLESIIEEKVTLSSAVLSLILDTTELLDALIIGKQTGQIPTEAKMEPLRVRYTRLLGERATTQRSTDEDIDVEDVAAPIAGAVAGKARTTNAQRAADGDLSVRVRLQKLDELVNLFGELLVSRSILEERIQRLVRLVTDTEISSNRLNSVGQKLESRFEAATLPSGRSVMVMPGEGNQESSQKNGKSSGRPSHFADFDELELDRYTEFHQLARGLSEGISDMKTLSSEMDGLIRECEGAFARETRLSATFQDRLMKARLVPLSTMAPRLYRTARAMALKQHKDFEFIMQGEKTEVDRTVFEEIAGPLLHLVRNAVNHAIETPEERVRQGKQSAGRITLSASYEGNQVMITVRDDGRGIDPEKVRATAVSRGLISLDHVLSENELIELIFRPGFSTAQVLSEESGRGVGLDVVRDSVSRLRGSIEVESTPGQGTAFTMKFPTSLAIQSAMMVHIAGQQFAIPTVMVQAVGRLDTFQRTTVGGQTALVVRNDLYTLSVLAHHLSLPSGQLDEKAPLLLVNAGGQRVALVVDDVKGSRLDIVVKNLGPHLRHVHGIAGGTILGNGQVVLILELTELLANRSKLLTNVAGNAASLQTSLAGVPVEVGSGRQIAGSARSSARAVESERGKHILVVDDSPSVRRVVGNMLKQHGWEVRMARDGVEALETITHETPAAVLLDIEMPRMDGYELVATLRAQEQFRTLPLVVLTSRAAAKHQQRAMQLGANAYVVKPYQDEELLRTLSTLVYGAVAR